MGSGETLSSHKTDQADHTADHTDNTTSTSSASSANGASRTDNTGRDKTDQELVDAYIGGDGKAFSAIVERHRSRLTTVARRYTHNDTDAQDIVQEALLRASRKLHTYRREARLGTWLHRLVMNSGYDFLNHRSNRENYSLDAGVVDEDYNHLLACTDDRDVDLRLTLCAALRLLRPDQRVALWLIDVAGFDVAEVARQQGVAPGTIKSRRARAKGVLKEAISFSP